MQVLPLYAELQCLTNFSFLKGASHPEELVRRAAELGYAALAITDECSLAGVVRAHAEAKDSGLKLLIGSSFVLDDGLQLVLLATSLEGYGNLSELITLGRMRCEKGVYRLTRADLDGSPQAAGAIPEAAGTIDHLAGLPDCLALWIPARDAVDAQLQADADWLATTFARPGEPTRPRAWIAVQRTHRMDDELVLKRLIALGTRKGLRCVATGDVHMHVRSRKPLHDTLTAVRLNRSLAECGDALAANAERHLRSRLRLPNLFPQRLLDETVAIADACSFSLKELGYRYPKEIVPDGWTQTSHLRRLTEDGLVTRYPEGALPEVRRQVDRELALIADLGYEAFFLTVHDIVRYARSVGILCQGRGSAANSAVCFCLGITEVDPALQNMLFERFLTKERNEPPDIDVDFEHQRREEVIQYIYDKYGRHRTALAATVIAYRTRSAIRDVGKALGLDGERVNRLSSSHAWWEGGEGHRERLEENGFDPDSPVVQKLVELTSTLRSFPRHLSQHVGGFVISADKLSRMVPIENAAMLRPTDWDDEAGRRETYAAAAEDGARQAARGSSSTDPAVAGSPHGEGSRGSVRDGAIGGAGDAEVLAGHAAGAIDGLESRGWEPGDDDDANDHRLDDDMAGRHETDLEQDAIARRAERELRLDGLATSDDAEPTDPPLRVDRGSRERPADVPPLFPTFRSVIQWDKDDLEELGLLKVDVLALGMLSAVRRALDLIGQRRGRPFRMIDVPKEDSKTYDMICKADTVGVFQIESRAQMSMLPRMLPRNFYDLVVEVAIVRPGPIQGGMVHPYLKAREDIRNGKKIAYPAPAVEEALARTLGVPIFQEQVMQLMMLAADFSAGEADKLRRAMAAWKRKGGLGPFHDRIVNGMIQNGYERDYAERIFKQVEGFGEYGFPESHAASFAFLVYISCWIKCHEPAAFLAAMLNSQPLGFYSSSQLIQDAQRHDIEVRPIDVTISQWDAVLEEWPDDPASSTDAAGRAGLESVAPGLPIDRPASTAFDPVQGVRPADDIADRIAAGRDGADRRPADIGKGDRSRPSEVTDHRNPVDERTERDRDRDQLKAVQRNTAGGSAIAGRGTASNERIACDRDTATGAGIATGEDDIVVEGTAVFEVTTVVEGCAVVEGIAYVEGTACVEGTAASRGIADGEKLAASEAAVASQENPVGRGNAVGEGMGSGAGNPGVGRSATNVGSVIREDDGTDEGHAASEKLARRDGFPMETKSGIGERRATRGGDAPGGINTSRERNTASCEGDTRGRHRTGVAESGPASETPQPAVRLGFNSIRSFNLKAAARVMAAREERPFTSVEDLGRRAALSPLELDALAAADALTSLAGHRRQARWQAASHRLDKDLMQAATVDDPAPPLPLATEGHEIVDDYASTGFTLRRHPLALLRPRLRRRNLLSAAELHDLPNGRLVKTTGIVTVRQRPGTAKGTIFLSLEDETGVVNVIVWNHIIETQRRPLLMATLLTVHGLWQRQGEVRNVVAHQLIDESRLIGRLSVVSRDFH